MDQSNTVLPAIETAYEWVDACAECLSIERGLASLILTTLCGYETWYDMAADIGRLPPTPSDETVSDEVRIERHSRYVTTLTSVFDFELTAAIVFITAMSPSCNELGFESFPFSLSVQFHWEDEDGTEEDDDEPDLHEGLDELTDALRLSGECIPHVWYNTLANLNWPVVDETFNENPDIGVPAFMVDDPKHGMTPIYVSSVVRSPGDDTDGAAIATMAVTKEAIVRSQGRRGYGLLFWKHPQTNNIGGEDYCYVGMLYSGAGDQWDDMFLRFGCSSAAELIALHEASSPEFSPRLADKDQRLFWAISFALDEVEPQERDDVEVMEMRSPDGWMMALIRRP